MSDTPDFEHMTDAERAAWHESRRSIPEVGRAIKRRTRDRAETHLSVRLYPEQIDRLRELSVREGRSVSALVRLFVGQKLDELVPREMPTVGSGHEIAPEGYPVLTRTGRVA
jgi:hypothetical protein